jgi:hypothetical protein
VYIHPYWTGPLSSAWSGRCTTKCTMTSKEGRWKDFLKLA